MRSLSVLIPDGESDSSFIVLTCLAQIPKTKIHVLSRRRDPRARFSRFCSSFHIRDSASEEEWFELIAVIVRQTPVDVILPVFETGTRFVCAWRERLSEFAALPLLPGLGLFDISADKGLFAGFIKDRDLPSPRTTPAPYALEDPGMTYPLLIKPRRSHCGIGIQYYPDQQTLEDFVNANREILDDYIAQEFVVGYDIGCNALCKDGQILAYTMQRPIIPHRRRFAAGSGIKFVNDTQVFETSKKLISALNWTGIGHIDLRYNESTRRPEIIELNPSYWGTLIGSLVAGVNFPYLSCLASLKIPLPESQYALQQYLEIRDATKMAVRRLNGDGGAIPNFMRETNLPFILRDPAPFLNRFINRS